MNKTLLIVMGVMVLIALILGGILFSSYNTLVTKQQNVKSQWSLVENQMQRRADLIPNIVGTVKGVAGLEERVFPGSLKRDHNCSRRCRIRTAQQKTRLLPTISSTNRCATAAYW